MTKQQAFDKMIAHLAEQGERCMVDGRCSYRGPYGTKCVVGAMISDESVKAIERRPFSLSMVSSSTTWAIVREELLLEDLSEKDAKKFYSHMQMAHDGNRLTDSLKRDLWRIAEELELDGKHIDTITRWS